MHDSQLGQSRTVYKISYRGFLISPFSNEEYYEHGLLKKKKKPQEKKNNVQHTHSSPMEVLYFTEAVYWFMR